MSTVWHKPSEQPEGYRAIFVLPQFIMIKPASDDEWDALSAEIPFLAWCYPQDLIDSVQHQTDTTRIIMDHPDTSPGPQSL